MFNSLVNWMFRPITGRLYTRRRNALEAEFHKNTPNRLHKVIIGLRLLTEPVEYGYDSYVDLPVRGTIAVRCQSFQLLSDRLQFLYMEYNRALASTVKNPEWTPLPEKLSPKRDTNSLKWLDEYFETSNPGTIRNSFWDVLEVLQLVESTADNTNPERDIFLNQISNILRELETIVEHYL